MDLNSTNLSICRICLCQDGALKSIFTKENFSERMLQVNEVMTTCASIQVEIEDGLPQEICTECFKRLSDAYAFKNLCEQTDFTLRNNLVIVIKSDPENVHTDLEPDNIAGASDECKENIKSEPENVHTDLEPDNIAEARDECKENIKSGENIKKHDDSDSVVPELNNIDTSSYENKNFKVIKINSKHKGIYKCKICSKQLTSRTALTRHNKLHLDIKPYECDICKQRFPVKNNMVQHRKTHSNVKPYMCDVCGLGFNYKFNLLKHKKHMHGPVKLRECPVCKTYFSHEDLQVHLTTHSVADKTHQCDHCGKCFYNTSKLKRHIKTHTGVECSICRKYFADKTSLGLHRSTHTDADKTHQCSMCGMRFYTSSKLMRHMETHTGKKKPHTCLICDKHFRDSYNLRQHVRVHTGEKDFGCDVCGKSFTHDRTLTKHRKQHTANELKNLNIKDSKVN